MANGSLFESINLNSSSARNDTGNTNTRQADLPLTTSDEDELDPTEFLSPESPNVSPKVSVAKSKLDDIQNRPNILNIDEASSPISNEDAIFLNPSKLASNSVSIRGSTYSDSDISQSFQLPALTFESSPGALSKARSAIDEALGFLIDRIKLLYRELASNVQLHKVALTNGDERLSKVRSMISQNFEQLAVAHHSLNELYMRDMTNTRKLYSDIQQWDLHRSKILEKIINIKSDKNRHGAKLTILLDETNAITQEISELEKRLEMLKLRKRLINSEIEETSSVLESRTSKYVTSFKELESNGKELFKDFLVLNGVPLLTVDNFIKKEKIDVTFVKHYNESMNSLGSIDSSRYGPLGKRTNHESDESFKTLAAESRLQITESKANLSFIGMQPFIPPDEKIQPTPNPLQETFKEKRSNAFEEGLSQGSKLAKVIKEHMTQFMHNIIPKNDSNVMVNKFSVKIDDVNNTISHKILTEPIFELINNRIQGLNAAILESSRKAVIFHKFQVIWKEVVEVLKSQERTISSHLSSTLIQQFPDKSVIDILRETLERIHTTVAKQYKLNQIRDLDASSKRAYDTFFHKVLLDEILAVKAAIMMVDSSEESSEITSGFKGLGFTADELQNIDSRSEVLNSKTLDSFVPAFKFPHVKKKATTLTETNSANVLSSGLYASDGTSNLYPSSSKANDFKNNLIAMADPKQVKKE
ncbi:uncharacterized protein PRCAT00005617001 [Priceomyces carsonii]|uniref:uncharacterized protein n=1 Tax=Priceomyces carsonii TaxID=28549 RepID=UPI002ED9E689|nr:unnamed protein product [Priceomyces carsonii]